jgi:uracil-DNA glycosylase
MNQPRLPYDPRAHGAKCDECPLQNKIVVPPELNDSAIVIVGDSPGKMEEQQRRIFTSATGMKLAELLRAAGMPPRSHLTLTSAILCRPEIPDDYGKKRFDVKQYMAWLRKQNGQRKRDGQPLLNNPFDCCRPRLVNELKRAEVIAKQIAARDATQFPNGAVIFPVGNFALAELMGVKKRAMKVLNYRGSVMPAEAPEFDERNQPK